MVVSRDSRTVILSDGSFSSHQTTIVDSFYCTAYIILFKIMHMLLNQYYTENRSNKQDIYTGSVLFRASAFTGAKLASGVPTVIGRFEP